jgi:putative ABC transport system permease protein
LTLKALPLRLAVNRLLRQPWSTLSQLAAFSLSFMLLALLLVLRGDLLDRWQQQLPPESPNYFLINIAPEQVVPVKTFLAEHQTRATEFYPIVRARLTQINGQVTEGNKDEALNRELNLTWSASVRIIIRWWPAAGRRRRARCRLKRAGAAAGRQARR